MANKKVNLNFKVDVDVKGLLDQLVVLKTMRDMKKSSQHAVLEEALVELMRKYNDDYRQEETING